MSHFFPKIVLNTLGHCSKGRSRWSRECIRLEFFLFLRRIQLTSFWDSALLDHYSKPRNPGSMDKKDPAVGTGLVGAPACGDVMKLQIRVDEATGTITDAKFKTFGCGSAIASSSYLTELVKGMRREFFTRPLGHVTHRAHVFVNLTKTMKCSLRYTS